MSRSMRPGKYTGGVRPQPGLLPLRRAAVRYRTELHNGLAP